MSEASRNIEIKAKLENEADFQAKMDIGRKLTSREPEVIKQHDVFFNSREGRLKLRYLEDKGQLVHYSRDDTSGPKLSKYNIFETQSPKMLEICLRDSLGILGVVDKTRHLFLHNQTRIHLDNVKDLGYFLEFEVVLKPEDSIESGQQIAEEMMGIFQLKKEQLLEGAYMDQLLKLGGE